ncbi:P-loop containing nucleoside triphosphate hydrolase protein [Lepidopterella palustris CBS 459.81]|uniref:P-loop containing nucleoside triphosphate hydrolase protein n=1 Tax=Lepidopterella palustris CBS 459.81 TaxID=1314670 RepID=A0A8E2E0G5_9PEZI|nr:P-loop containing nucleoside triphosphate hydrolase protein [Lepidopterella palustris CBS 459.81]
MDNNRSCSELLWCSIGLALNRPSQKRHPYFGSSVIASVLEVARCILVVVTQSTKGRFIVIRLTLQALRISLLVGLSISNTTFDTALATGNGDTEPLLAEQLKDNYVKDWRAYMKDFYTILPYLRVKDRKIQVWLWIVIVQKLVDRAFIILVPRQLSLLLDSLNLSTKSGHIPWRQFILWIILYYFSKFHALGDFASLRVRQHLNLKIKEAAFGHVLRLSMDFHNDKSSGDIIEVINLGTGVTQILDLAAFRMIPLTMDLIMLVAYLSHTIDVSIGLLAMAIVVIYIWIVLFANSWLGPARRDVNAKQCDASGVQSEAVHNWEMVTSHNGQSHEQRRISITFRAVYKASRSLFSLNWLFREAENLVVQTGKVIACLLAVVRVASGTGSVTNVFILINFWSSIFAPLSTLANSYSTLMQYLTDGERLSQLLRTRPSVIEKEGARDLKVTAGRVEFNNVSFSYPGSGPALKGFSFAAESGTTTALVGMTGSGKSTTLKLMLRFMDPTGGNIEVDGQDIRDVTLSSLRDNVGIVPQTASMMNTSIMENIKYGLSATDEEVIRACEAASIHDQIMRFPKGYETVVGERGVKLSGGELQRIAIARVVLKDPKIVLLDEATSAVDSLTEVQIQNTFRWLAEGRTTFVVAHRLSTIKNADIIVVINEGEIRERGGHDELLDLRGLYYKMWLAQTKK